MEKNNIIVSKEEYYRLLNQSINLESLLDKLESQNYKLDVSHPVVKNLYDSMHEEVSNTIRLASKKLERLNKQEIKSKKK